MKSAAAEVLADVGAAEKEIGMTCEQPTGKDWPSSVGSTEAITGSR